MREMTNEEMRNVEGGQRSVNGLLCVMGFAALSAMAPYGVVFFCWSSLFNVLILKRYEGVIIYSLIYYFIY